MFCRSVMSAVPRAYSVETSPEGAQLLRAEQGAVGADPHHEVLVVELVRLERGGLAAVEARARWV